MSSHDQTNKSHTIVLLFLETLHTAATARRKEAAKPTCRRPHLHGEPAGGEVLPVPSPRRVCRLPVGLDSDAQGVRSQLLLRSLPQDEAPAVQPHQDHVDGEPAPRRLHGSLLLSQLHVTTYSALLR